MKSLSFGKLFVGLIFSIFLMGCVGEPEYLDQNWTEENQLREKFYTTSQGSQLIPYNWFLALEKANSKLLISSDEVIVSLGYLPDYTPDPTVNPDGLPVGFVKDADPETGDWMGVNCAACHTAQLIYNDRIVRIDGAPALGDFIALIKTVRDGLSATLKEPAKFKRFTQSLGVYSHKDRRALRSQMAANIEELNGTIMRGVSEDHLPGFGRVDAFTSIRNEVFQQDLGIEENFVLSSAPVSYPFLWDTPELDRVQWAGNADNPFARNAGQVLGVLGRLDLKNPETLFKNSIRRENLFLMEQWIRVLKAPQWPEEILGAIDIQAAERGRILYSTIDETGYSCESCHSLKNEAGFYPLTPAEQNAFGKQFIQTQNIPVAEVGTDPSTLQNIFSPIPIQTGILASLVDGQPQTFGATFLTEIVTALVGTLFTQEPALTPQQRALYSGFRVNAPGYTPPPLTVGYKARPLAGIWATSPFLHNGSVPTLYDLLLPPLERPVTFAVGDQHFDPKKVGYVSGYQEGLFYFDTRLEGNLNSGHLYGTYLNESDRLDLLEFLKTL